MSEVEWKILGTSCLNKFVYNFMNYTQLYYIVYTYTYYLGILQVCASRRDLTWVYSCILIRSRDNIKK